MLAQLDRLKMEVSFSESDIGKVEVGQPATVSISSMEGTELAGRVTKVDVLPSEGSSGGVVEYPATILLTQRAQGLRAGMSASAEVVVEQVADAVTVPNEAIASGPSKTVTVSEDGREAPEDGGDRSGQRRDHRDPQRAADGGNPGAAGGERHQQRCGTRRRRSRRGSRVPAAGAS